MTISDRRLDRIWRRKISPVVSSVEGWDQMTPYPSTSTWVSADPGVSQIFERDPARLGRDLEALWRLNGRGALLPLAPVIQDLAGRISAEDKPTANGVSSLVYEMN
jgi:hypothetical protein